MRQVLAVALLLLLGCSPQEKPVTAKKAERIANAEAILRANPQPRSYDIKGNQLLVIDVPTSQGMGYVDSQKCFVWRDAEYKTTTMQCPNDSPGDLSGGPTTEQAGH